MQAYTVIWLLSKVSPFVKLQCNIAKCSCGCHPACRQMEKRKGVASSTHTQACSAYRIQLQLFLPLRRDALSSHSPGPASWVYVLDGLDCMRPCQLQQHDENMFTSQQVSTFVQVHIAYTCRRSWLYQKSPNVLEMLGLRLLSSACTTSQRTPSHKRQPGLGE